mmetsp:Transcript_95525/g.297392  ORF Transcript_95525/g.297392 Transcript_95525/m.297392 type:complete len:249 (-) Transcript_95525:273-1019(-)
MPYPAIAGMPCGVLLLLLSAALVNPAEGSDDRPFAALVADDECAAEGLQDRPRCALNALQYRAAKAVVNETADSTGTVISVYHWSPHWQCFIKETGCRGAAKARLNAELRRYNVDFGHVIELMDDSYSPPPGYAMTRATCNDKERSTLLYHAGRWAPAFTRRGCMRHKDRAFVVQVFTSRNPASPVRRVVVVGAHYPHSANVPALQGAVSAAIGATGERRVIFMATRTRRSRAPRSPRAPGSQPRSTR